VPKIKWTRWSLLFVVTIVLISLSACASNDIQSWLSPSGPIAKKQLSLLTYTSRLGSFVLAAVIIAILTTVFISFRRKSDELPVQSHGNVAIELGLIAASIALVTAVAIPTIQAINELRIDRVPLEDALIINITGYQWWWQFEYPEAGILTANEIHIPRGKNVIFNLDSADVLHSFWVPKLAGKKDLIPNQKNQLWFATDENTPLGEYYGQCAELCLGAHAYMKTRVIVDSPEDYQKWLDSFGSNYSFTSNPEVAKGKQLFTQKGCAACHAIKGFSSGSPDKPNLSNFGLRTTVGAGLVASTPENVAAWIANPQAMKPGNYMPTLWQEDDPKREEESQALAAFLLSLGKEDNTQASVGGNNGN